MKRTCFNLEHLLLCQLLLAIAAIAGCSPAASDSPRLTPTALRAERRAYAGAPPVIPHPPQSSRCVACHSDTGLATTPIGVAPPNPHRKTPGMGDESRCVQCHVFATTKSTFDQNTFVGLSRPLHSTRAHATAPPTIPHPVFMREDCRSCHVGPAARPEIRCTHSDRVRCVQCHVPSVPLSPKEFARQSAPSSSRS